MKVKNIDCICENCMCENVQEGRGSDENQTNLFPKTIGGYG